ncbi:M20 family metallopeptidase [Reyranella soli]|jgi:glutamate carboxypeptidase|uniref:Carboxypeptidase n=1 Tax=Reyranella soli TaxID=1230389 RepID=A0A512NHZ5_9HYPH|nr:M20 family metallopeptidase [Reyranella soli]GEP58535.1 carboxypeptidase [Reyranella soli]
MAEARKNEPKIEADEVLAGIVEWVSIESPSHDGKSVNKVVDHVEGQFRDLGLKLERVPGRDGFGDILECKTTPEMSHGEGKGILVLAHLDTVHPIGMIERDLKIRREGDSIFGPGIYDMKAGGYIAYYALRHLMRMGKKTKLPVTFLFIPEEEVGSPTSRTRIEEAARGHKYALVMEPGRDGDRVVTSRKGVGRFTLTVKGTASHAGVRHQDGRSAIHEMAKQIMRIEGKTDYARGITCNVGLIQGGSGVNVVPAECKIEVDLRVPSQQLAEEMTHWFLNLEPIGQDVTLKVEGEMNRPPYQKDAGISALFEKAQAIYREIGKELLDVPLTGGGSDGNFTAALGIPTLDGLGADGKGAHAAFEQIYYSSLVPRTYLCTRLLETLE